MNGKVKTVLNGYTAPPETIRALQNGTHGMEEVLSRSCSLINKLGEARHSFLMSTRGEYPNILVCGKKIEYYIRGEYLRFRPGYFDKKGKLTFMGARLISSDDLDENDFFFCVRKI